MKVIIWFTIFGFSWWILSCSIEEKETFVTPDPNTIGSGGTVSIFTKSTALNSDNVGKKSVDDKDWIYDEFLHVSVVGARCRINEIDLLGDIGDPWYPTGIITPGHWIIFSDTTILFDLDSLQKLMTTDNTIIHSQGDLNTLAFGLDYLELDLVFKGIENTIRLYWSDDSNSGAKQLDILIQDSLEFKWIHPIHKNLIEQRPIEIDSVIRMHVAPEELIGIIGNPFMLDNFGNLDFVTSPPPWGSLGIEEGDIKQFEVYYTIDDSTSGKDLNIILDLSFKNAATFREEKGKYTASGIDTTDMNRFVFTVVGNGAEIYDLEGNPISSSEFNIYDILPGFAYPGVFVHVEVKEVE